MLSSLRQEEQQREERERRRRIVIAQAMHNIHAYMFSLKDDGNRVPPE
jgi:hypothetical protein